jgi:orotate phosphoribosyltransferase
MNTQAELLDYLATIAYKFRPERPYQLASGKLSKEYLDCKLALSRPGAMVALGKVFRDLLSPNVVAIGGLTMGADPIAMSVCQTSATGPREIRWFTVRKEPKTHGERKLIEGSVDASEHVAIVDDVVTSGDSTIKAIRACREADLLIEQVIVLVDREEMDGLENIRREAGPGVGVLAVFKKSEIKHRWEQLNPTQQTFRATA